MRSDFLCQQEEPYFGYLLSKMGITVERNFMFQRKTVAHPVVTRFWSYSFFEVPLFPFDWTGSYHLMHFVNPYQMLDSSSPLQCLATTLQVNITNFLPIS